MCVTCAFHLSGVLCQGQGSRIPLRRRIKSPTKKLEGWGLSSLEVGAALFDTCRLSLCVQQALGEGKWGRR